jgi:hypothetical protein
MIYLTPRERVFSIEGRMARGRRGAEGSHVCLHNVHFWREREPAPGLGWLAWAGWHLFLDLSISKKIRSMHHEAYDERICLW